MSMTQKEVRAKIKRLEFSNSILLSGLELIAHQREVLRKQEVEQKTQLEENAKQLEELYYLDHEIQTEALIKAEL